MQQIGAESQVVRHWEKTQSSCSETAKTAWGVVQVEHQNPLSVQIWWGMVQLLWTLWAGTLWGLLWPLSPSSMNTKLGAGQKAEHVPSTQTRLHHRKAYLLQKIPGEEFCFSAGALQFTPPHTAAWNQILGKYLFKEACHRGGSGPRQQHNHLNSCSHSTQAPSTRLFYTTA